MIRYKRGSKGPKDEVFGPYGGLLRAEPSMDVKLLYIMPPIPPIPMPPMPISMGGAGG